MRKTLFLALLAMLAGAERALALTITVKGGACQAAINHTPSADVEYRPGVDVHGKPVAPADLNGGFAIDPVRDVIIDIGADLARRLGRAPAQRPFIADASVGYIVFENGRLLFNGRPLQDPLEQELAALCAAARRAR